MSTENNPKESAEANTGEKGGETKKKKKNLGLLKDASSIANSLLSIGKSFATKGE